MCGGIYCRAGSGIYLKNKINIVFGNNHVYNKKYRYNILLQENNYTDMG